jgi:hypothetical protein
MAFDFGPRLDVVKLDRMLLAGRDRAPIASLDEHFAFKRARDRGPSVWHTSMLTPASVPQTTR